MKKLCVVCLVVVLLALVSPLATRQVCGESSSFGYTTMGASSGTITTPSEAIIAGSSFVCGADGYATNMTVGMASTAWFSNEIQCAIYAHNSSLTLLGETEERFIYAPDALFHWQTFNFAYPYPNVSATAEYILVVWGWSYYEATSVYLAYDVGDANQGHFQSLAYDDFPNPLVPTHNDSKYSVYCAMETGEPPPPPEGGEWENNYNVGSWLVDERTNVVVQAEYFGATGTLEFRWEDMEDFYGWEGNLTVNSFNPDRDWYEFSQEKYCNFTFTIHGTTDVDDVIVVILFQERIWLWGALFGYPQVWAECNGSTTLGGIYPLDEQAADPYPDGAVAGFRVVRDGSGLLVEVYAYLTADWQRGNFLIASNYFPRADAWFDHVTISQRVYHQGKGHFNITLTDSIHETVWYPDPSLATVPHYPDIFDLISGAVYNVLPAGARVWVDSINGWIGGLWALVIPFWGMCLVLVPLVPVVFVVYFLDVAKTSVDEGSFAPIGEFAMMIFSVASSVIGALIGAVHAVWDILHFW